MAAALALPVAKFIGTTVASHIASQGLDYAISKGIPTALRKGRQYTYKKSGTSKGHRAAYKALTGVEKAYHSGPGHVVRGIANVAGQAAINFKTRRKLKGIMKPKK